MSEPKKPPTPSRFEGLLRDFEAAATHERHRDQLDDHRLDLLAAYANAHDALAEKDAEIARLKAKLYDEIHRDVLP